MSFIEFLLEYYVWILTVLVVLIIGVIGFMVDAIQSDKKKNNDSSVGGEDTKKLFGKKKKKEDKVELKSLENDEPLVMEESKEGLVNPSLENNVNSANIDSNLNNIVSNNVIDNNNLSNEVQDISTNLENNVNGNMNIGMEQVNVVSNNQGLSRNIMDDIPMVPSNSCGNVSQVGIKEGTQASMSSGLENNVVPSVIPTPVVDTPVIPNNMVQSKTLDVSNNNGYVNAYSVREPGVMNVNMGVPVSNVNQGINNVPVNVAMVDVPNNFNQNTTSLNSMGGGFVQSQPVANIVPNQTIPNVPAMGQNNNVVGNQNSLNNQMPVNGAVNSSAGLINPSVVTTTVGAEPFNISDMFANSK